MALAPLTVILIAAIAVASDRPEGYIQRTALGVFAFLFFGVCLGHFGYLANDSGYRPIVLLALVTVELNDVFAYTCGRLFGRRKLAPHTSPNKTWGGAIGAMILTMALVQGLGRVVFDGPIATTWNLAALAVAWLTFAFLLPRAIANHRWYKRTFPDYPRTRRALLPFVL